jgi:hypothetical protein
MSILDVQTNTLSFASGGNFAVNALATYFSRPESYYTVSNQVSNTNDAFSAPYSSFTLTPKAEGENWQMNIQFRGFPDNYLFAIDPNGTITDSGNLSGASAATQTLDAEDFSGPFDSGTTYICELPDAIFIFGFGGSGPEGGASVAFHGGKILTPLFGNDDALGLDGLGMFYGPPGLVDGSMDINLTWLKYSTSFASANTFRVSGNDWAALTTADAPENMGMGVWRGRTRPDAVPLYDGGGSPTNSKFVGYLKYCFSWSGDALAPSTRWRDPVSGQTFLMLTPSAFSSRAFFIPWEDGVIPT